MRSAARRARRVLTVSQASKQDILHYLRIPAEKIEVIYNALDERLAQASDTRRSRARARAIPADVAVRAVRGQHQAAQEPRPADRGVLACCAERGLTEAKLLIIGDEISKYPNLRRLVHRFQLHQHVRFLGFVPDATLAVLYRLATVFVFPSLYEGFGLPPLEAMAAGTPVITSNVSSLPEVVGDAALLIDPMDAGAIADAMARVLGDAALRAELVRRGHERVKAFSWERSVGPHARGLRRDRGTPGACLNRRPST